MYGMIFGKEIVVDGFRKPKIPLIFDMETADPDDILCLAILVTHPACDLKAITLHPGSHEQVGLKVEKSDIQISIDVDRKKMFDTYCPKVFLMIQVPYSKMDLLLASLSLDTKLTEEKKEQFESRLAKMAPEENKMKEVAKYIGISLETLVDSPNLDKLIRQYENYKIMQMVQFLEDDLELTNKEAWAFVTMAIAPQLLDY